MYHNLFFLLFMGIWVVSSFYKCCPECSYLLFGTDTYAFLLGVLKGVALPGDGVRSALVGSIQGGGRDHCPAPHSVRAAGCFDPQYRQFFGCSCLVVVSCRSSVGWELAPWWPVNIPGICWPLAYLLGWNNRLLPIFWLGCLFCFLLIWRSSFYIFWAHICMAGFFWGVFAFSLSQWCLLKSIIFYFNVPQVINLFSNI